MRKMSLLLLAVTSPAWTSLVFAQQAEPEKIPFEGGVLTITETTDGDKAVAFDGEELARNYVAYFDRMIDLGETKVALFAVGDGGNQCGPSTVIVWKPKGEAVRTQSVGDECGAPPAAATAQSLYFVPYLTPGATGDVQVWSPDTGLTVAGSMSFTPQPDTRWDDLDPEKFDNIVQAFDNAEVYDAAKMLLGDSVNDFATGLLTGGGTEKTSDDIYFASGCVPHSCGSADSFMAVDKQNKKLFLAQQVEGAAPQTWPAAEDWPATVLAAMRTALAPPQ